MALVRGGSGGRRASVRALLQLLAATQSCTRNWFASAECDFGSGSSMWRAIENDDIVDLMPGESATTLLAHSRSGLFSDAAVTTSTVLEDGENRTALRISLPELNGSATTAPLRTCDSIVWVFQGRRFQSWIKLSGQPAAPLVAADECASSPCGSHGMCLDSGQSELVAVGFYICSCEPGWAGRHCNGLVDADECASSPCRHGVCFESGNTREIAAGFYICECVPGWSGANCAVDVDECETAPCAHGSSCVDSNTGTSESSSLPPLPPPWSRSPATALQ